MPTLTTGLWYPWAPISEGVLIKGLKGDLSFFPVCVGFDYEIAVCLICLGSLSHILRFTFNIRIVSSRNKTRIYPPSYSISQALS